MRAGMLNACAAMRRRWAVEKRLRRLGRIGFDEAGVGLGKIKAEDVHHRLHPADHAHTLAKIDLGVAGRMRKWHERFARPRPGAAHIILHHRVASREAMLIAQPLENPLGGVALLGRGGLVALQEQRLFAMKQQMAGFMEEREPKMVVREVSEAEREKRLVW